MSSMDSWWPALAAFLFTAVVLGLIVLPRVRSAAHILSGYSRPLRVGWMVSLAAAAALLFRPHGEAVLGLDTTGYRLMSEALSEGRPMRGADAVLQQVPEPLRTAFLFLPDMTWRNTRDISFQLLDVQSCETAPFFYPSLPLAAAGFDRLLPGDARDGFVPLVGWIFFAVVLTSGAAWGGWCGLACAWALLLGTPLPAWFLRGFYPEAVASVLVGLCLLAWSRGGLSPRHLIVLGAGLGLALTYHPLLVVLVVPAILLILATEPMGWRRMTGLGLAFLTGVGPLYLLTRYVCQPYGDVFNVRRVLFNVSYDGKHAAVVLLTALAAVAVAALGILPPATRRLLHERARAFARPARGSALLLVLALAPLALALLLPASRETVLQGVREVYSGTRPLLLLLVALLAAITLFKRAALRPRLLVLLLVSVLPVFLYLKGAEPTGFWSQRRWLPVVVLATVGLLPAVAFFRSARLQGRWIGAALTMLFAAAALANAVRWPAPYLLRSDHDADAWRRGMMGRMGGHWTFFDYFHRSFCFAVDGRSRALGLGPESWTRLPEVIDWLGPMAAREGVLIATAYRNPGMEAGVELVSAGMHSTQVARVRSKKALPAEADRSTLAVELLEMRPARDDDPPALHKVMDGGPLALRGPWLQKTQRSRSPSGEESPAMWCRAGAGVMGPLPRAGHAVDLTVVAEAGRRDDRHSSRLRIGLPWGGSTEWRTLSNAASSLSWRIRPPTGTQARGATGLYRIEADETYDPRSEGIRSYPPDLVALVQRVDAVVVKDATGSFPSGEVSSMQQVPPVAAGGQDGP